MSAPKDRLKHLLELAADPAPDTRAALKSELEALLADWPGDYPESSRTPFAMLLEKVSQEMAHEPNGERAIAAALRAGDRDRFIALLARAAGTGEDAVWHALGEDSGAELALLCREAGLSRATFSAIVVLMGPARTCPSEDVERVLQNYDTARQDEPLAAE